MTTVRDEASRRRAATFAQDAGLDRVPEDLRPVVAMAYLKWIQVKELAPAKAMAPGDLAVLAAEIPETGEKLELPCRVVGAYSDSLWFVSIDYAAVPSGYRQAMDSMAGFASIAQTWVTVATDGQLRHRVPGSRAATYDTWDPFAVVLRERRAWTVRDEIQEREGPNGDDDDEEGTEWE